MVCNLNQSWNGITPKTCTSWYITLQSAVARLSTVIVAYGDAPNCDVLPLYLDTPAPNYVMLVN